MIFRDCFKMKKQELLLRFEKKCIFAENYVDKT